MNRRTLTDTNRTMPLGDKIKLSIMLALLVGGSIFSLIVMVFYSDWWQQQ